MNQPNLSAARFSASRAGYLAFLIVGTLLYAFVGIITLQHDEGRTMNDYTVTELDESKPWQVHLGELPMEGGRPLSSADEWQLLSEARQSELARGYREVFWLRLAIPPAMNGLRDPAILVQKQWHFDVYIDRIHYLGLDVAHSGPFHHPRMWSMAQLPNNGHMQELLIRIEPRLPGLVYGEYEIGNSKAVLLSMVRKDIYNLIYSLLFALLALISIVYFLRTRKDYAYLSFGILTASAAAAHFLRSDSVQLLQVPSALIYWCDNPGIIGTGAFMLFLYHFAGPKRPRIFLWQAAAYGLLAILMTILVYTVPYYTFAGIHQKTLLPMFAISAVTTVRYIVKRYREHPDQETGWMLTGLFAALLFMLVHLSGNLIPARAPSEISPRTFLTIYLADNAAGFGVLLFALSIGMALITRMARIRDEHEQLTVSLEQMVEQRTAQLEKANRLLAHSIQERSEAMAEMFVLQERNRIAGDIHDVVGHTLTATVLQIDAATRLLRKQDDRGLEKLDLSAGLIRKSLQDIRESVHMMKTPGETYDLQEAIETLTSRTIEAAGVSIQGETGELPELTLMQKKVLYHALQEGITNGIRHGGAVHFYYELLAEDGQIRFTLWNDGRPYTNESFGFGLNNMLERVRQIGGSLTVMSLADRPYQIHILFPY